MHVNLQEESRRLSKLFAPPIFVKCAYTIRLMYDLTDGSDF